MSQTTTPGSDGAAREARENPVASAIGEDLREMATSKGIPSREIFGVLPIRRIVPQDLHSLVDYASGFRIMAAGLFTDAGDARAVSLALGASIVAVSSMTDYRLSPLKIMPIEIHEVFDYLWGASAIAAPFVLGYRKRAPLTAALHIVIGSVQLLASLFTDYRGARGAGENVAEAPQRR